MSKLWSLTKVLIKTNLLAGFTDNKNSKRKYLGVIGICFLLVFVVASLGVPIIFAMDSVLEILPIENIIISFILPLAGITTIIFSVFSVVSVFYLSKDSEHLLPLPIDARDIMLSKFLVSLINEYYILFMFILPCLVGVGVGIDASIMYYVYTILIFMLLPIIPSIIVTFIILVITRFTGAIKNKDLFMYVSMGLIVAFALGYNYIIQNFVGVDADNIGATIGSLEKSVLPYFKMIFPFYNSASSTLINYDNLNGLFSFISFLAFNLMAILFIYIFGDRLYLKVITSTRGSGKNNQNIDNYAGEKIIKSSSSFIWLLKKEWLVIKRTPIFMLNIVVIVLLMPIIVVVSMLFSLIQQGGDISNSFLALDFNKYISNPLIFIIILAIGVFFTSSSVAASTSISREGSSAWFMKVIPISYFKQINAKVFFAVFVDMIGVIILGIVPIIMYKIPLHYVACVFVPLLLIVILLNYISIYIDLKKPKLNWNEESAAVKQNINSLVSILIAMAICAILGILGFMLYYYNIKVNVLLLSFIISLVSGILLGMIIYMFYKNKDKLLDNVN